jgi:chemotaxis protein methyltransferase CheR
LSLSPSAFSYLRTLVQHRAAICLEEDKLYLAEARLTELSRREGFESVAALMERVLSAPHNGLAAKVVEAMTTNETYFFRDVAPFEALRKLVLPELTGRRAAARRLQIWCAASSSGQEPYSVAMLLREHFPQLASWRVDFLATDLSAEMVERARRGRYSQIEVNRGLPAPLLVKYFVPDGPDWRVRDDVRRGIEFRPFNLIHPWAGLPRVDILLLRNVLIYFDVPTKKQILARARQLLRPDGYLFLGGAETTFNLDDAFERVDFERASCYRLRAAPPAG